MNKTLIVLVNWFGTFDDRYNLNVKRKYQDNAITSTLLEYYFAVYSVTSCQTIRDLSQRRTGRSTAWRKSCWGHGHRNVRRWRFFVTKTGEIYHSLQFLVLTMKTSYFGCKQITIKNKLQYLWATFLECYATALSWKDLLLPRFLAFILEQKVHAWLAQGKTTK